MKRIIFALMFLALCTTARITNAQDMEGVRDIPKPDLSKPIFEKQKWDENRLNLLKEVFKQESIETVKPVSSSTTIRDFGPEIKLLQKKYNLQQTGSTGPMTVNTLNNIITRRIENPSTIPVPVEKTDFYRILLDLPCLNGNKLLTDCSSSTVDTGMLYQKRDVITNWLKKFEESYRKLQYTNLVSQVNTIQSVDTTAVLPTRPVSTVPTDSTQKIDTANVCNQKGPTLDELQSACPSGYNAAQGECNSSATTMNAQSTTQCALGYNPWKKACNQPNDPARNSSSTVDNTPRVMFWCGKVNQYWNTSTGRFESDPDGVSGGHYMGDPLTYCKKMYPTLSITTAVPYKRELSQTWAERGNLNNWTSMLQSYACK